MKKILFLLLVTTNILCSQKVSIKSRPIQRLTQTDAQVGNKRPRDENSQSIPSTPTHQKTVRQEGDPQVSKVFFTPNATRYEIINITADSKHPANITLDNRTRQILINAAIQDIMEEHNNCPWHEKDPSLTNLFSISPHVLDALAMQMRTNVLQERNKNSKVETPEKRFVDHTLTLEHMINIIQTGTAYLCLPTNQRETKFRIDIVAQLEIAYSEGVKRPERLTTKAFGTVSFMFEKGKYTCMHYFNQREHPSDVVYTIKNGTTGEISLFPTYLLEPIAITAYINPDSKLHFRFNGTDAYPVTMATLGKKKEQIIQRVNAIKKEIDWMDEYRSPQRQNQVRQPKF